MSPLLYDAAMSADPCIWGSIGLAIIGCVCLAIAFDNFEQRSKGL